MTNDIDNMRRRELISEAVQSNQNVQYPISLRGTQVFLTRIKIHLDLLALDPKNQRIQFLMTSKGFNLTDQEIEQEMWKIKYVQDLADSIFQNGGLLSPLIIKTDGTVVEGNSRLVALRQLIKRIRSKGMHPPETITHPQVEILPENFPERELLFLLGEWHIAGKHEWNPYEQAEFIYRMWKEEGQTYDTLVSQLRMSKSTIRQKLNAYEMMREYLTINSQPQEIYKWSYFEEFNKKKELRDRLESNPEFKLEFFDLVKDGGKGKFEGMNVRKLPEVLHDAEAWELLKRTKDFKSVEKVIDNKKVTSALYQSIVTCTTAFDSVEIKEIFELKQSIAENQNHAAAEALRILHTKVKNFSQLVGIELEE